MSGLVSGCSPSRAFDEWVLRRPEAVRFGCPTASPETTVARLLVSVELKSIHAGPSLSRFAGNLNQHPDSLFVPFSDETPPLVVLKTDLDRILKAAVPADVVQGSLPLQLNATLQQAYVARSFYVLKKGAMNAQVVFDFTIVEPLTGRTNWAQRIFQEYSVSPAYVTSRSVEEALNGAYCEALSAFIDALGSRELQMALRP